tara:strand:+ start:496 stop:645 length:150 start_codon:yes stop_codon:yes gene_type:complete
MYQAKPNLNNNRGLQTFETAEEAVKYLNDITGFAMAEQDWKIINKLIRI